jgi:hypothetical protein
MVMELDQHCIHIMYLFFPPTQLLLSFLQFISLRRDSHGLIQNPTLMRSNITLYPPSHGRYVGVARHVAAPSPRITQSLIDGVSGEPNWNAMRRDGLRIGKQ